MQLKHFPAAVTRFGVGDALKLLASRRVLQPWLPEWTSQISVDKYPHRFHYRHATTDKYVMADVLLEDQYACLVGMPDVQTIFDIGANIGATSVFLLNAYPKARVIALEPDAGNFAVLRRNLEPYGSRAVPVCGALWHRRERLAIDRGHFRDGGEWSFQVKAAAADDGEVEGVTLADLMRQYNVERVDILKVDIEGAEEQVFESSTSGCLPSVARIAIELHNPACREVFFRSISPFGGRVSQQGEVTLWER
jgi:FkbM family methyltransferase